MNDDAFTRIADALTRLAIIEEKKFTILHPERVKREGLIEKPEDEKREQYSDRADSQWLADTEAATPQGKSRFQERFETPEAGNGSSDAKKRRRPDAPEGKNRRPGKVPKGK